MKYVTLIQDREDIMHFGVHKWPEHARKEVADRQGHSQIIYCAVLRGESSAEEIERKFHLCYRKHRKRYGYAIHRRQALAAAIWLAQIQPWLRATKYAWRRRTSKPIKAWLKWKRKQIEVKRYRWQVLKS
ncbi:hypothetical protein ACFQ14_12775 [Pseudahrensia aquimaris]|uniref:Uncharacterized protein n=1 Tax=Pseudahrensia aquimaris TaxID=744461 RepID=A0ABW3FK50_9HYPH